MNEQSPNYQDLMLYRVHEILLIQNCDLIHSNDVDSKVKNSAKTVLKASRGQGVIKELSDFIL